MLFVLFAVGFARTIRAMAELGEDVASRSSSSLADRAVPHYSQLGVPTPDRVQCPADWCQGGCFGTCVTKKLNTDELVQIAAAQRASRPKNLVNWTTVNEARGTASVIASFSRPNWNLATAAHVCECKPLSVGTMVKWIGSKKPAHMGLIAEFQNNYEELKSRMRLPDGCSNVQAEDVLELTGLSLIRKSDYAARYPYALLPPEAQGSRWAFTLPNEFLGSGTEGAVLTLKAGCKGKSNMVVKIQGATSSAKVELKVASHIEEICGDACKVVKVYKAGQFGQVVQDRPKGYFMLMEEATSDLAKHIRDGGSLIDRMIDPSVSAAQAQSMLQEYNLWLQGLEDGINALHSHNIYHNDVKPANIALVRTPGRTDCFKFSDLGDDCLEAKLFDYGWASAPDIGVHNELPGDYWYTFWSKPSASDPSKRTRTSDSWGLGMTALTMLFGYSDDACGWQTEPMNFPEVTIKYVDCAKRIAASVQLLRAKQETWTLSMRWTLDFIVKHLESDDVERLLSTGEQPPSYVKPPPAYVQPRDGMPSATRDFLRDAGY